MAIDVLSVQIEANTSKFKKQVQDVKKDLSGVKDAKLKVDADTSAVKEKISEVKEQLQAVAPQIIVDLGFTDPKAQLKEYEDKIDQTLEKIGNNARKFLDQSISLRGDIITTRSMQAVGQFNQLLQQTVELKDSLEEEFDFSMSPKVDELREKINALTAEILQASSKLADWNTFLNEDYGKEIAKFKKLQEELANTRQALAEVQAAEEKANQSTKNFSFERLKKDLKDLQNLANSLGFEKLKNSISSAVSSISDKLKSTKFGDFTNKISELGKTVKDKLQTSFQGAGEKIAQAFSTVSEKIKPIFSTVKDVIVTPIKTITDAYLSLGEGMFKGIKKAVGKIKDTLGEPFKNIIGKVKNVIGVIGKIGKGFATVGKAAIKIGKIIAKPFTAPLKAIGNSIKRVAKLFVTAFVFNVVRDKFKDIKEQISGMFSDNEGLQNALTQLSDAFYSILAPIVNAFMPVLTQFIQMLSIIASKIAVITSNLLGKTIDQTKKEAQAMKEAGKAADLTTASFDELNQIGTKEEEDSDIGKELSTDIGGLAETELTGIWASIEKIIDSLSKLIKPVINGVKQIAKSFEPIIAGIADSFEALTNNGTLTTLIEQIVWVVGLCNDFIAQSIPILQPVIESIIEAVDYIKQSGLLENVSGLLIDLMNILTPIITSIISNLMPVITDIANILTTIIRNLLDKLKPLFDVIVDSVMPLIKEVLETCAPIVEFIGEVIGDIVGFIVPILTPAIEFIVNYIKVGMEVIKTLFNYVKKAYENITKPILNGIMAGLFAIINFLIDGINLLIKGLNLISFDMPDWLGGGHFGFDLKEIKKIEIPKLANGGIVNSPTLAEIGEKGSEAVIPLTDTTWMHQLRDILGERDITIEVDGQKLGKATIKSINAITRQTGKNQLIMA